MWMGIVKFRANSSVASDQQIAGVTSVIKSETSKLRSNGRSLNLSLHTREGEVIDP